MSLKPFVRRTEAVLAFLAIFVSFALAIEGAQKANYASVIKEKLTIYSKFGERFIYNQTILSIRNVSTGKTRISKLTTVAVFITVVVPPVGAMMNENEILVGIQTKTLPTYLFPYILISILFFSGLILFGGYLRSYLLKLKKKVRDLTSGGTINAWRLATTAFDFVVVLAIAFIAFLFGIANIVKLTTIFSLWLSSTLTQEYYYIVLATFIALSGLLTYALRILDTDAPNKANQHGPKNG